MEKEAYSSDQVSIYLVKKEAHSSNQFLAYLI
jgi:hypothetical protein